MNIWGDYLWCWNCWGSIRYYGKVVCDGDSGYGESRVDGKPGCHAVALSILEIMAMTDPLIHRGEYWYIPDENTQFCNLDKDCSWDYRSGGPPVVADGYKLFPYLPGEPTAEDQMNAVTDWARRH